jgi:hypothetical protein
MAHSHDASDPASTLIEIAASDPAPERHVAGGDVRLRLDPAALARLSPTAHLYLRLEGVCGHHDAAMLGAVLKGASPDARERLGVASVGEGASLYGLRRATAAGPGMTVQLNATPQIAWLRQALAMGYGEVAVSIQLARPLPPGERLSVARVRLCTDR